MQISQQALNPDGAKTMFVLVKIGGNTAVALVDTGSNSTFTNIHFALQTSCTILQDKSRPVAVAGGGRLWSGAYIPPTEFTIATVTFHHSFRILDMTLC